MPNIILEGFVLLPFFKLKYPGIRGMYSKEGGIIMRERWIKAIAIALTTIGFLIVRTIGVLILDGHRIYY